MDKIKVNKTIDFKYKLPNFILKLLKLLVGFVKKKTAKNIKHFGNTLFFSQHLNVIFHQKISSNFEL